MPDYSKSKIYKIVCNETGKTYYGSTTQSLSQRMAFHRYSIKKKKNCCSVKSIIELGNYDIILCEEFSCENKEQLHMKERQWIDGNICVNKNKPIRFEDEKLDRTDEKRKWYERNRDTILKKQKEKYYETKSNNNNIL